MSKDNIFDSSEHMAWYRDLVEELTGFAPLVRPTTVPVLIEGQYWQVRQVAASIPAPVGFGSARIVRYGETEAEALRGLCEQVHALTWVQHEAREWEAWFAQTREREVVLLA